MQKGTGKTSLCTNRTIWNIFLLATEFFSSKIIDSVSFSVILCYNPLSSETLINFLFSLSMTN